MSLGAAGSRSILARNWPTKTRRYCVSSLWAGPQTAVSICRCVTPREYDLLCALARNAGRVVTHRQMLTAVWGPAHKEDTQYLRVFVGQLRAKIERDPAAPRLIRTEPGVGYRFAGPVESDF